VDRLSRYAPLSGLVVFALFAAGNSLWAFEAPTLFDLAPTDASPQEVVHLYEGTSTEIVIGASISLVSIAFFVWFGAVLREHLEYLESGRGTGLPLAAFGGVLLAVAAGIGAETINMVGALRAESHSGITPDTAQAYYDVSQILGFNAAGIGLAVTLAATAMVAIRANTLLPSWLAALTVIIALTLLTPLSRLTFSLAFLLLPVISVQLYREPSRPPV
jgi:hypothetical protein